ncbi:GH36-type glycosyl hydrolase domain-containing protein [Candidatus Deferrimicrobium sp.]|uniref:GH36-type glycosyl hydrolase domain-containing protein n=1 Tax=Candidatus Deferrimicrobium sp. TaxID=3060586 RepID=UPI00351D9707
MYAGDEPPLRSELFSSEQMKQHGKTLAGSHKLGPRGIWDRLLTRLAENERVLTGACNLLTSAVDANRRIAPAGEWLLDNFYLIEEEIRTAKRHLPKGYSRELPRLLDGPSAGLPRVYDIAHEAISHGDGRVDPESLSGFVASYQKVTVLTLGELWAIPIMLRLALIENLRRVGARVVAGSIARDLAARWAEQMMEIAEKDPKSLILLTADMARSNPPMVSSFVAEFARRLQGQSTALALPLTWIEQRLSESGRTIEQMVRSENQQKAADQVSISNSIGSLRFLGGMDWREFVETMSAVDQVLREDPGGAYGRMDFTTRDRYRHVVEKIAKRSSLHEAVVVRKAILLAGEGAARNGPDDRTAHVGFYLIDKGLPRMEREAGVRLPLLETLRRVTDRFSLHLYLGSITLLTVIFSGALLAKAHAGGLQDWLLALFGALCLLCASRLGGALVNWLATVLVKPHPLPRMDFSEGIPPESRTLVVVPTMLTSPLNIESLVESLEVLFLANRDDNLHFGLLTDFRDANEETIPEDEQLLRLARKGIEELNDKYGSAKSDPFFLFHRPRRWNPRERTWMGYERKRGKLAELNLLLRGGAPDCFSIVVGKTPDLSNVKFVISLDTDTQLPRDSARQFIGAMAHPLNRPRYDERMQRVSEGHGILQPRVADILSGTNRSRYARLFGSEAGIDPYTRAVSDVYQDVFDEGSFIGKGIYDVDAFEQALKGRLPENRILSHDLLEGCYARAGLLSDANLYEEYPSNYIADVDRRHRWIRGDWQIAGWLLSRVLGPGDARRRNPLSGLSQWKIFDNLRRSLEPSALTLLLLVGWNYLSSAWYWTLSVIGILLIPSLLASALEMFRKPADASLRQHLAAEARSAGRRFAQAAFTLACLPYEAFFGLDAVVRTGGRMLFTHKRLLEWRPSGNPDRNRGEGLAAFCRSMWIAPVIAAVAAIHLVVTRPVALASAGPILALWFASPAIAWWISRPLVRRRAALSADQILFLRKLSRKTWAFFETFVGPEDHWLPPDNYQEYRVAAVAHRTSPTNMGLALLANLAAYDFGYLPSGQLVERTENALRTMEPLARHRGHFYNWYDTQSLEPLLPLYVSTVDSGNLSAHLLTLRQGLLELPDHDILGERWVEGISDTFEVLVDAVDGPLPAPLAQFQEILESSFGSRPTTLAAARVCLERLAASAGEITASFKDDENGEPTRWARALERQCRVALDEVALFGDFPGFDGIPTLRALAGLEEKDEWPLELRRLIPEANRRARERITAIDRLALLCEELARVEYDFLYDKGHHLLAIGYNVSERRRDSGYYDLLASEARLCTFVAIAQGQLPQESWFALGRLLTAAGGEPILLSWSGSMFEYLMPLLVMPTYENTLIDRTCKAAVGRQIEYGKKRGVPWGMSESGYNMVDVRLNYQYRAFGVPGLGLKRGLASDLVVAPYASALALMVAPEEACRNLQRLGDKELIGKYGFYEAIDYTPSRQRRGQTSTVVRSFMAHHQGMSLLSLDSLLLDRPIQKRFESDPLFQATTLLLQERVPKATASYTRAAELSGLRTDSGVSEMPVRSFGTPHTPVPEVQLLSNGRYHVMITNSGGGYSRWKDIAVTRWREDGTCDNWGTFCYIRDTESGEFWSTAYQPTLKQPEKYEAIFSEARVEFRRRDHEFDTHTEIAVSPEDDAEVRRVRIVNRSQTRRTIEITSYAEVVLASPAADALHPAFGNLFVQTEIVRERQAILCTRRPRSFGEPAPWMFHLMSVHGADVGEVSYETDRMRFIGRGNTVADPQAVSGSAELSDSQGSVLDPIVAIRHRITLGPDEAATVNIVSGVGETRDVCMGLIEKHQDRRLADRVFDLAWTHSQVLLQQINATEADAQLYGHLASSVIYANPLLRADASLLGKNRRGQSGLWGYSISGDFPIVLLQIGDPSNIELVRQLVEAHAYWRLKGLAVDLVIWNEDHAGYRQLLQEQILGLIAAGLEAKFTDRPGGIFLRLGEQISSEDRILFQMVSRAILTDSRGTLWDQIHRRRVAEVPVPRIRPARDRRDETPAAAEPPPRDLIFFNGLGGFTPDGREYVITTAHGQETPAPWVNVLANPTFGSIISESGQACTWSENAHEFRLTPWNNDPVSDSGGEAFYIRDEESGTFWSPTSLPCRGRQTYVSRHGFGYSVFEHAEGGIRSELWVYVALDAPVKFSVLKVRNESGRSRKLSATGYAEWVLGDLRPKSAMHVVTQVDPGSGALLARNSYNTEFTNRVAFFDVDDPARTVTGDRVEFLGRNGSLRSPAAMTRVRLSGKVGAALDPCAAIQVPFELADGQEREIIFRLGAGKNADDARTLVNRFRGSAAARGELESVWQYWKRTLGTVQVETPDPAVNVLANGWLLYQALACRVWARSGYYQSGGAFGFRDQLQDAMALVHSEPHLLREHLLRCAARQFREGDVQHWWNPPSGRGVRTKCSDDFLWLPLATCRYVLNTGDTGVLDESVHFIEGRPVNAEEDSYYDLPVRSEEAASLYEHCRRAILRGLGTGEHGLPLMGSGDWNDGMNLVGEHGKGESVWLGFFLYEVLMRFSDVARNAGDVTFAERCRMEAAKVRLKIEQNGWDGEWYRRAYFDDGSPLGSASNAECRIDSIAQSWSVLSGAGDPGRSRMAMDAVDQRLVRRDDVLIQLLDPPFDKSALNPGYIKGYVPGVRENGGQYTHAAIWAAMAFAALGDSRRAWELLGMINPVTHSKSPEGIAIYKVEPYVVAADVYALPPHTGRGGWTWYTGSAGWMYRLIVESLLGLTLEVDKLRVAPCLPADWKGFKVYYRYRETVYEIDVRQQPGGEGRTIVTVDGIEQQDEAIPLVDDRRNHTVEVVIHNGT